MTVVAVAGGSASIGRTIVDEILSQGKFEVIILARKADEESEERLGARVIVTDYSKVDELVQLLETNNVHTVISALGPMSLESEQALIQAADISASTKRFIASVWGIKYRPDQEWFPPAVPKLAAVTALEKTNLEWTTILNGFFLDYWAAAKAAIPGSGSTLAVFTYSGDVAKYTAAALTLGKWEKESYVIGSKISWNDFVKIAEEVRGMKFDVTYDTLDILRSGKITELPGHVPAYPFFPKEALQGMFATFGVLFDEGQFDFPTENSLNSLFPEIKPMSIKEMVEIGWKN
ncbi:hypothetical protein G7Z17_g5312 [Cylindrodendrum hubeiense]|uniref:NAD(P)-binding domain-containing protein n=1 Tax=Cylindrodendrum hubeiense TaxID=595255 RepID=A0A9P5H702_9HYPO|nr:hypothetical protein G7Z17_g5312 [Cylindrodendrum hubeiense]